MTGTGFPRFKLRDSINTCGLRFKSIFGDRLFSNWLAFSTPEAAE